MSFASPQSYTHNTQYMKKLSLALVLVTALSTFFVSCSTKDQAALAPSKPKAPAPQDTVTNFYVYFSDPIDSSAEVAAYEDQDGPGPMEASFGGVSLKANTHYIVTFVIEDGTNPAKTVYLNNKILSNARDYKLCISSPLGITIKPTDSDGLLPIGLENELNTSSTTGNGSINFSLKYQKGVKNGQCEPGTTIFNANFPISVY